MIFTINSKIFLDAILNAKKFAEMRRKSFAFLDHVQIGCDGQIVTTTSTDLENQFDNKIPIANGEPGRNVLVSIKDLITALGGLGEYVTCTTEGRNFVLTSENAAIKVPVLVDEMPTINAHVNTTSISVDAEKLKAALKKTSYAMSSEDVRYYLNGMLFELIENKLRLVATNGQRLATTDIDLHHPNASEQRHIIPRKTIKNLQTLKFGAQVEISHQVINNADYIVIHSGEWTITTKAIDGKYPDYQRAIPHGENLKNAIQFSGKDFCKTIKPLLKVQNCKVNLSINGSIDISGNDEISLAATVNSKNLWRDCDVLKIGFSSHFLNDAISRCDQLTMYFSDPKTAILVASGEEKHVIAPMR